MSRIVGKLAIISKEGMGWKTVGELKNILNEYDDNKRICFVESIGEATKLESVDDDGLYAPFDFELEDDILYIPIYDGNILTFMETVNKEESED